MSTQRRAPRMEVVQTRSDREAIRPFVSQLGEWQARLAKLDAARGYSERRGGDPSQLMAEIKALRNDVSAGLSAYDSSVCGRPASTLILATREAYIRLLALIDTTLKN